ncbi:MAG: hypothetical protein RRC34_04845 [Lentisphaeria bacterium]|nr:hypothetical protein [Lentisphaeria bacterium]
MGFEKTRILITVITYPVPSAKYNELVCTAGLTEAGEWVRIYPIPYRHLPYNKHYHKFQWIEIELDRDGRANDKRRESWGLRIDTLRVLGDPIGTKDNWRERRHYIDRLPHNSLTQLEEQFELDRTSLGVVRPKRMLDFLYQPVGEQWSEAQLAKLKQLMLFDQNPALLTKIPYKFSVRFECEDGKEYTRMIEDWETGMLYLNEEKRLGSQEAAAESVRAKYLNDVFSPKRDPRLFVGTTHPYNTWIIVGVFWPPLVKQPEFDLGV